MSKGSNRRPTDEAAYADGFDRIFRGKPQVGCGVKVSTTVSNIVGPGAGPGTPATEVYVDDATGKMVDEDFWP